MFYSAYVLVHSHSWFRTLTAISFLFFRALHQSFSFCQHFPILPAPIILPLRPVFVIKSARKFLLVLPRKLPLILQASLQLNYASSNFLEPNRLPAFQQELGRDLSTKKKASDYQSATTAGKIYNTLNAEEQGTATKLNFLNNHIPQGNLI